MRLRSSILLATIGLLLVARAAKSVTPQLSLPEILVAPEESKASIGQTFQVNINIENAVEVNAWEVYLRFNPTLLVASNFQSGGFLSQAGLTMALMVSNRSQFGYVQVGESLAEPVGASGSGTLLELGFTVVGLGSCSLQVYNTSLLDVDLHPISHTSANGSFLTRMITVHTVVWETKTYNVSIESDSNITAFGLDQPGKAISFNVTGETSSRGYANVSIPKTLLDANMSSPSSQWIVLVEGNETAYDRSANATHTFLLFNYSHSTKNVRIVGATAVPEFHPLTPLSIVIILTALALAARKKRSKKTIAF